MTNEQTLTCIGCPMGCGMTVRMEGDTILSVEGNGCKIGDRYARNEITHPERTVTSTVAVTGGSRERLPVKTAGAVPKARIFDCMREINRLRVAAPVRIGDVLSPDLAGTGVSLVATGNVSREE